MTVVASHKVLGQGPDLVLLLHGIGGGQAMWDEAGSGTLQALADAGLRALALDFPGYGGSVGLQPVSLARMVDAVTALIRTYAPRRVALVGHSMGGMVAQELLATQPGVPVHALVLACTSPAFGSPTGRLAGEVRRRSPGAAGRRPGHGGRGRAPGAGDGVDTAPWPRRSRVAMAVMARVPEATYRAALQAIVAFDRRAALPAIAVPTLCLAGEHDKHRAARGDAAHGRQDPGAVYQCLAGAGHIANVEQPDAFHAALVGFLKANGFGS
jgi:3-oxoadipate enol-lactonase